MNTNRPVTDSLARRAAHQHLQEAARKAAESAIALAMVTSAIPGLQVRYIEIQE